MTKRKLALLIFGFLLFEVFVWSGAILLFRGSSLLVGFVTTICGLTVLLVYVLVSRLVVQAPAGSAPELQPPLSLPTVAKSAQSQEIADLIRQANEKLANSPALASRRINSKIADFPLYLVVGTEGTGK